MEPLTGTEAIIEGAFVDMLYDLAYGGGWMDMEQDDIDQECNWALVSIGGCLGHRRSNYLTPSTDRIHVPSASAIHYFRRHGPTYIHERFLLRRVCATLNTANNSLPVPEQETFVLILLAGGPSSGNKRPQWTDVLMRLVACPGAERSNSRVSFAAAIVLQKSFHWLATFP